MIEKKISYLKNYPYPLHPSNKEGCTGVSIAIIQTTPEGRKIYARNGVVVENDGSENYQEALRQAEIILNNWADEYIIRKNLS